VGSERAGQGGKLTTPPAEDLSSGNLGSLDFQAGRAERGVPK
jgi:hypothetical protein